MVYIWLMVNYILGTKSQAVRGVVVPSMKPTEEQIQKDNEGIAAYNPVMKDLIGSRPTLEQVKKMISEPMKSRGKQTDFRNCTCQ